jgi:NitT/TauT family transport system substrate-binding protein
MTSYSAVRVFAIVLALILTASACAPQAQPPAPVTPSSSAVATPSTARQESSPSAAGAPVSSPQKVRYGDLRLLADAGIYIAMDEGYFTEQGIDLELVTFDSAANMVAPLATNQLEAGGGAPSAGLYNALRNGVNVRIVADKGHNDPTPPGFPVANYIIRKALLDSGQVRNIADLRGLRFAVPGLGISPELGATALLKEGGLTLHDMEIVLMGFSDLLPAFANDNIDLAHPPEPFATLIVNAGTGAVLKRDYEVHPNHQVAVLLYSPDFSKSDLGTKFMIAYLKGVRLYDDAYLKGDSLAREKSISAMVEHSPVKDRRLYDRMALAALDPDGKMNLQSFEEQQDFFLASGTQQGRVDLQSFIDLQHIEAAVRQLGPYQR